MGNVLGHAVIAQYREEGYFFPVPVLSAPEVASRRRRLEAYESERGHPLEGGERNKSHLLFKWVDDLMRHPPVLDAVEDLVGPDILCWNTLFWIKEAGSPSFVSWHQDIRYWGLDTDDLVTAWIALSPASEESGCMRVLAGSHQGEILPHRDEYDADNLLTRGQSVAVEIDQSRVISMPLAAGEMSLHNVRLAHASGPNRSGDRRIGLSLHYMPARTRQLGGPWDSAALVRGEDRYGHFEHTPIPARDLDPVAVAFHERATNAVREILFRDAEQVRETL